MSSSVTLRLSGLVAVLCASLLGCPRSNPVPDAGPVVEVDAGPEDAGIDAGPVDAGFKCRLDDDCAALNQGMRCNVPTSECVPAKPCNDSSNCESQDETDYCYHYGVQCRCVSEANDAGTTGVCRRRRGVCEECTEASQCGLDGTFDPIGTCKPLTGDPSGKKYCFQAQVGSQCPCGMINDQTGFCRPQANSCESVGCSADKDCPGGSVCNVQSCLCENRCVWDFKKHTEALPGCGGGKTCWVDSANLDPNSHSYGAGRCKAPCGSDVDCTGPANPYGGANLKCSTEKLLPTGESAKRCRANGACMDDAECPNQPVDSIYNGYCDRGSFQCKSDCRTGLDPINNQPFNDCRNDYKCVANGQGANQCVLKTCVEMGGARIACRRGQFCCGEDKNRDGVADPCPATNLREPNGCYDAPTPPFCTACTSNAGCNTAAAMPSWAGTCANGSKSPSCSPLPNLCVYAGDKGPMTKGINVCAPSTYNDTTKSADGVGNDQRGCPAGYTVLGVKPKFTDENSRDYCSTDAECGQGNGSGLCQPDTSETFRDGGHPLACLCTQPGQVSNCPNTTDGGITSVCKAGIASPSVCLQSVVCAPGAWVYKPAGTPDFGCGL